MRTPRIGFSLRALGGALVLALAASCATTRRPAPLPVAPAASTWVEEQDSDDVVKLTVVGTNDLHGWIEPHERDLRDGGAPILGGIDIFAGYMKILREKRPGGVVLLDGGDLFQGTLVVNMTEGQAVIKAYNLLDYDAAAVGNHEFDYGPRGSSEIAMTDADDPLGNIKYRIAEARFPFLVGNVYDKVSGKPVSWFNTKPSVLLERKGIRIGVIGLSTPMTPAVTLAQNVTSLEFRPLAESAVTLAAELRSRGAQIVLLTLHAGTGCNHGADPKDATSCDPSGELYKLLHEIPAGTVDAAVAGHTHQYLANFLNGTPSIQSASFGIAFGVIELWFDKKTGKLVPERTAIWPTTHLCRQTFNANGDCRKEAAGGLKRATFMGEQVSPDEAVAEALRPDIRMVEKRKNEALGPVLEKKFGRSRVKESELGDFVTDVMRSSIGGAHLAMTNSGGLRADLGLGPLTYGDVFNAIPFENRLATMELTGTQLLAILRQGVSGDHGILQVSGVRLEVLESGLEPCAADAGRLVSAVFDDGSSIDPAASYVVVANDFMAGGGDGFDKVLKKVSPDLVKVRVDLPPLREMVVSHLRIHPELTAPPPSGKPRITFVRPVCAPSSAAAP